MELAVEREAPVRGGVDRGVLLAAVGARDRDGAGEQVDPELHGGPPGPRDGGAVERLGAGGDVRVAAEDGPLLRQQDHGGPRGGGAADEAVRGLLRRVDVGGGEELDDGGAHGISVDGAGGRTAR
ncbi:unannotated protein [freshwater metagenome]|uniref:Unannotated protein n=1 Tax=freshwater metagenome TaxID=449393 RepID=A0A6J7L2M0_9ZZZZ